MKVTFGPIVSDARGRFGGVVASNWKGVSLFRRFQPPSNPNSVGQQEVRAIFSVLTRSWTLQTTEVRAAWESFATGKKFIARNQYIGRNVPLLNGEIDIANLIFTPGDASTIAPPDITSVTPGVGTLTVVTTAPTTPTGWTLQAIVSAAVRDLDYSNLALASSGLQWFEGEDLTTPYSVLLSGLTSTSLYRVGSFIRWIAPDGTTRYSATFTDSGTPT